MIERIQANNQWYLGEEIMSGIEIAILVFIAVLAFIAWVCYDAADQVDEQEMQREVEEFNKLSHVDEDGFVEKKTIRNGEITTIRHRVLYSQDALERYRGR